MAVGSLFVGHSMAIVAGSVAFSVGLILALVASRLVVPKRIEGNNVWLARVHPSIVRALPPCI